MAPPEKLVDVNVGGTNFSVKAQYRGLKVIGRGSYGIVASCVDSASGDKVAIKRIKPMSAHASDAKHVLREVRCMRLLGAHNNVVAVRDLFVNTREDELYIVMELMDSDLHRIIQSPQALTDAHHRFFMYQLVRGVAYMHAHGVIHRDLKPGNLLVTRACELRITDFGLARLQSVAADGGGDLDAGPMTQHVVTRWYRPPELMLTPDGRYTNAVDMWSVGCILAELLGRRPLYPGKNFVHQLQLIFASIGSPPDAEVREVRNKQARKFLDSVRGRAKVPFASVFSTAPPAAHDLLEDLLLFNPEKRAGAAHLLAHDYFRALSYAEALPVRDPPADLRMDFGFETQDLSAAVLRRGIIDEVAGFSAAPGRAATAARDGGHKDADDDRRAASAADADTSKRADPCERAERAHAAAAARPVKADAYAAAVARQASLAAAQPAARSATAHDALYGAASRPAADHGLYGATDRARTAAREADAYAARHAAPRAAADAEARAARRASAGADATAARRRDDEALLYGGAGRRAAPPARRRYSDEAPPRQDSPPTPPTPAAALSRKPPPTPPAAEAHEPRQPRYRADDAYPARVRAAPEGGRADEGYPARAARAATRAAAPAQQRSDVPKRYPSAAAAAAAAAYSGPSYARPTAGSAAPKPTFAVNAHRAAPTARMAAIAPAAAAAAAEAKAKAKRTTGVVTFNHNVSVANLDSDDLVRLLAGYGRSVATTDLTDFHAVPGFAATTVVLVTW
ncbi:kinase-like domain-containing protein [Pelagophyceae sp. CCMP2097]|nr:kinase-like domain-containing protein [Pelagophyceae sp. CCMP2097]